MANRYRVEQALELARGLERSPRADPRPADMVDLMRQYSAFEFDVPPDADADGLLFQYGTVGWFDRPTFVVGLTRQLEVLDERGEHVSYLQVQFECRFDVDEELAAVESHSEWWFPGGDESVEAWLATVADDPVMTVVTRKPLREFEIWQDVT